MIKFIALLLIVFLPSFAFAEYTTDNKIIKVVMPQSSASGLGVMFAHIDAFAKKQNINLVPVFKPGADGKIGIDFASKEKNDGNTLLFSTISDYVISANDTDFDKVSPVIKTSMTLIASKKSNIKNVADILKQERESPGKLNWAHAASVQLVLINNFAKAHSLDKIYKVPFSMNGEFQTSIVNGDIDIAFIPVAMASALVSKEYLTVIDLDEQTKQKMSSKENGLALFLPKNSPSDSIKFWNNFVKDLVNDVDFKEAMKKNKNEFYSNYSPDELNKIITKWKM